jgi:pimeloyl-ACP methyl ester carboxylesterase
MAQKILLLHGALGSAENLNPLKEVLQKDFQVFTYTFQGHGGSQIPSEDFTISNFANDVLVFLEENSLDKIIIFGYSMGGYVGLYLAKYFPEKVEKLYTLATKLNWNIEGSIKEAAMLNPTKIKEKVPKYAAALEQLHGSNWEVLMGKTAKMMLSLGENPVINESDYEEINVPVLISVGDKDVMVSIEESVFAFRKIPNCLFYVMPNTIHPIEKVDVNQVAHQIKNFIKITI